MGRLLRKIEAEKEREQLLRLKESLEKVNEVMDDTTMSEEEKSKIYTAILEEKMQELDSLVNGFKPKSQNILWDFTKERSRNIFVEDEEIYLRGYRSEENEYIRQIKKENSGTPELYEDDELWKQSSNWLRQDKAFICSIFDKKENTFIGYISIKDTESNLWEIAIELLAEHCNKGYGTRAIRLFLPAISAITSKTQFQALVEPDNIPSQMLMEKCGAKLIDIYDYSFEGDEDAAADFEERHLDLITERMKELAKVIDVEPRQMLSHVLDYRFFIEDGVIVNRKNT